MMRTAIGASVSLVQTIDDATTQRGRNVEARLELSQAFNLWLRSPDDAQARAFVRWSRSGSTLRLAGVRQPGIAQWTLNAGLGLRVF
jgi:hypothetical protein